MLEVRELLSDTMFEEGFQTGRQEAQIKIFIRFVRHFHKHRDDPCEKERLDAWKLMAIVTESLRPDQVEELEDFVRAYPRMPEERLAIRIIQESEYIYAMYNDMVPKDTGTDTGS